MLAARDSPNRLLTANQLKNDDDGHALAGDKLVLTFALCLMTGTPFVVLSGVASSRKKATLHAISQACAHRLMFGMRAHSPVLLFQLMRYKRKQQRKIERLEVVLQVLKFCFMY